MPFVGGALRPMSAWVQNQSSSAPTTTATRSPITVHRTIANVIIPGSRPREEIGNSKIERTEASERNGACGRKQRKRQRTAALQNLAEGVARYPARQRLGVRLSSAALTSVRR